MRTPYPTRRPLMPLLLPALLAALPLVLAACAGDARPVDVDAGAMQAAPPTGAGTTSMTGPAMMPDGSHGGMEGMADGGGTTRMVDGVQVAHIEAGRMGYQPRTIALEAGVPARLVFTRTADSECSSQVKIPAFGVPVTDLPIDEPVAVAFTPAESGTFEFVCGMDMQRGSLMIRSGP